MHCLLSKFIKNIVLTGVFAILFLIVFSQESKDIKRYDKKYYEEVTKGVDYTENIKERESKEIKEMPNFNLPNLGNWSVVGELIKIIAIITLVLVLAYFIYKLFEENYGGANKAIKKYKNVLIENLEQHIHEVDLHQFLKEALKNNDFKLAVRIYYLIIIKQLSDSKLINWKKQKTNGEYVSELFGSNYFLDFKDSTLIFERIWYGDLDLTKQRYENIADKYEKFLNKLPKTTDSEAK